MPRGEKLFRFLASLILRNFYGTVTIRFEAGKVTHVEAETRRKYAYSELPSGPPRSFDCTLSAQREAQIDETVEPRCWSQAETEGS